MTLVGIPLIFVLISTVEMARGMWLYHTLAYALKEGTRFAIVHGNNCGVSPNACQVTIGQIAAVIENAGIGLDPALLQVRMQSLADDTCSAGFTSSSVCTLSSISSSTTKFPIGVGGDMQAPITFTAQYPFQSAIAMFWPGAGRGMQFGTFTLPASSQERVQF